jgi:hypothetical protein
LEEEKKEKEKKTIFGYVVCFNLLHELIKRGSTAGSLLKKSKAWC